MAEQEHISFNQPWISPAILQQMNPNNRIGRYQIIKTLGEGSFGKVKLAFHLTTGQRVALKIINRKTLAKSDMQGRIEREISYLRLLRHPHIIKLYDVIKSKEEIIMVMEFAGGELFDYIVQKGVMKESDARRFFVQIICAVQYCHRHKIVHRDLKPENLLLDENLNIKIADFGLSNLMTDGNFLKTSCGSPNYAAPEVISGKLYAGSEVDVWSCGVILYVMLCGRLPFDDDFIPALFKKISSGVFVIPSFLSPGAKELIQKMLIVDPLNRITIDQVMENEWFNIDFPDYLRTETNSVSGSTNSGPGQSSDTDHGLIDEEIAKNLISTMGYNSEEVFDILKQKYIDHKEGLDGNEIVNAYDLLVENKKYTSFMNEHSPDDNNDIDTVACKLPPSWNKDGNQNFVNTYDLSPLADTTNPQETPIQNTISILPSSIPQYHRAFMQQKYPEIFQKVTPASTKKSKIRWHFGIRSKSYPLDVMGEIYRALKNLGTQWLKPTEEDLWTIKVRWKCNPQIDDENSVEEKDDEHLGSKFTFGEGQRERKDGDIVMEGVEEDQGSKPVEGKKLPDYMKMQIQLFQLEANNYLVDFKFDGWEFASAEENENIDKYFEYESGGSDQLNSYSAYPFLHMATRLIMELAVNSQN